MPKSKKKTSKKTKKTAVEEMVFACEATGKKVKFSPGKLNLKDFVTGKTRVFSSHEVFEAHTSMEREAGGKLIVHRSAIYADPRKNVRRFDTSAEKFIALQADIKENGILQPIGVIRTSDFAPRSYKVIFGFRRLKVAETLELDHVPVNVVDSNASETVLGMVENLNREDMKPMEIAAGIKRIMAEGYYDKQAKKQKKYSQHKVADLLGIPQSRVSDYIGLIDNTHDKVALALSEGRIPMAKVTKLKQLPKGEQVKLLKAVEKSDLDDVGKMVRDRRKELVDAGKMDKARHASGKSEKPARARGRKFKVISTLDLVETCMALEEKYFEAKGKKSKSLKAQLATMQYVLGVIDSPSDDPADPVAVKAAEKAKKAADKKKKTAKKAADKKKTKPAPAKKKKSSSKKPAKKSKKGKKAKK